MTQQQSERETLGSLMPCFVICLGVEARVSGTNSPCPSHVSWNIPSLYTLKIASHGLLNWLHEWLIGWISEVQKHWPTESGRGGRKRKEVEEKEVKEILTVLNQLCRVSLSDAISSLKVLEPRASSLLMEWGDSSVRTIFKLTGLGNEYTWQKPQILQIRLRTALAGISFILTHFILLISLELEVIFWSGVTT